MDCDYLVIGAGSAGAVLAARLSEDPRVRVMLVEAGPDVPPAHVPADIADVFPLSTFNPDYCWSDLRAHWRGAGNSPAAPFQQGRIVGGGSTVMGMWAVRGVPQDYDDWAQAGASGWGWSDVLPFFRRLESDCDFDGPLHGQRGPIPIRRQAPADWSPLALAMHRAAQSQGFADVQDMNADFRDGHCVLPISRHERRRASAGLCYLDAQVRARPNLTLMTGTTAERLLLQGRQVIGAQLRGGPRAQALRVRSRETLVCAGAVYSPALLMRSGIGPGAHLQARGVEVVADRPGVGANLQNHPLLPAVAWLRPGGRDARRGRPPASTYLRWSSAAHGSTPGDMGLYIRSYLVWHALGRHMATVGPVLMRPYSRGTVRLAAASPDASPEVAFNFFDDPRDLQRMVAGLRLAGTLLASPELRAVCTEPFFLVNAARLSRLNRLSALNALLGQGAAALMDFSPTVGEAVMGLLARKRALADLLADETALERFVLEHTGGTNHVAGTCRMGHADDPLSVVDAQGRVIGVSGLRVADASIMPTVPSGNTHLPTVMLAEKIASAMRPAATFPS